MVHTIYSINNTGVHISRECPTGEIVSWSEPRNYHRGSTCNALQYRQIESFRLVGCNVDIRASIDLTHETVRIRVVQPYNTVLSEGSLRVAHQLLYDSHYIVL